MKNSIILLSAIIVIAFSSCKKEYTCVCSTSAGIPGFTIPDTESNLGKLSKKKAEEQCNAKNTSTNFMGITISVSCKLK